MATQDMHFMYSAILLHQRVQFKLVVLVFKALYGQAPQCLTDDWLSIIRRCRCRSPSTTVIWRRHMCSATDPHVLRRSCIWCCRSTSVECFADQPPSASPLPWTVPTGA